MNCGSPRWNGSDRREHHHAIGPERCHRRRIRLLIPSNYDSGMELSKLQRLLLPGASRLLTSAIASGDGILADTAYRLLLA